MSFKIFDKLIKDKDVRLATEIIAEQPNDYVIPALVEQFEKIIDLNNRFNFNSSLAYFRNKNVKKVMDRIDTLLLDRFGINFKHISGDGLGYAVYPVPPKNNNNLDTTIEQQYTEVEEFLEYSSGGNKDAGEVKDYYKDETSILRNWYKSMNNLEKVLNTKGVNIDLQKAKISGLPKEYSMFIIFDPYSLITKANLTSRELVAVMLHEVGHGFTHLEYSYRTVRTTSVLIDSVQDSLIKKNKTFKDTIKIAYEEALDGNPNDIKDKNTVTALIKLGDKYIRDSLYVNEAVHSGTDSEQLADQFSGRFGMGSELSSALDKMDVLQMHLGSIIVFMAPVILMTTIYSILMVGTIVGGLALELFIMAVFVMTMIIQTFIESALTSGGTKREDTYDSDKRRYQRIKNEMIRHIRNNKLDKKLSNKMLNDIAMLDKLINVAKDEYQSSSWSDKLFRLFSSNAKHNVKMKEIEETIEDLMENDLYTMSLKFKTLKEK